MWRATRGRWEGYAAKGVAAIAEASKVVREPKEASAGCGYTQEWWFNIPTTGTAPTPYTLTMQAQHSARGCIWRVLLW